jgi:WD40 repeat protein
MARLVHDDRVFAVAFSPDGRWLATVSADGAARVWDWAASTLQARMAQAGPAQIHYSPDGGSQFAESTTESIAFSADGRHVLTIRSADHAARAWELNSGREVLYLPHETAVNGVAFSPDGRYLATAARNGVARLWEMASGRQVAAMAHDKPLNGLAFSPDGRYLATASNDHTVRLWVPVLEDPVGQACARVTRNLSPEQWRQYLGDEPYRATCPGLPA